jgi:hypothetical protein
MESRSKLSETIGQGDSRRTSLICPRSPSSSFTAIADTVLLAAHFFKAIILGNNNNRGGGLFLIPKS